MLGWVGKEERGLVLARESVMGVWGKDVLGDVVFDENSLKFYTYI